MRLRLVLLIAICCCFFSANAQKVFNDDKDIKEIDSLIYYNDFKTAEKRVDNLYAKMTKSKGNVTKLLELRYQKGLIIDNQFEHGNALPVMMEVLEQSEKNKLYHLNCRAAIRIAFIHEKANNYYLGYQYAMRALKMTRKHNFPELVSTIYVRLSNIHRFLGDTSKGNVNKELIEKTTPKNFFKIDSAFYYARKSVELAKKHNNEYDINEGNLTIGLLESEQNDNYELAKEYYLKVISYWKKVNNLEYAGIMYNNIAVDKIKLKDYTSALVYNDSAYKYFDNTTIYYKYFTPKIRAICYDKLNNIDSAYYYLKQANKLEIERYQKEEVVKTKNLEEQFENDKKQTQIENKNRQMFLAVILLAVITIGVVLLIWQNRKIKQHNKVINAQVAELSKTLMQRQLLLSELQHRVKNNLQHVISILEIQKESVTFNNINELIRGNQNRIHSMALLHKKLNVFENVNDVNLEKYVTELSGIIKDSYATSAKQVTLIVKCDIKLISIEKALPIGMIIVELISNSMKYAFKKQKTGIINIAITENSDGKKLYYSDNGCGFDFNKVNKKGLGMEIVKGLIDQINGTVSTTGTNGFEILIQFK